MTYPEMLSLSTSPSRLPKPNVGFQLHRKPLVWLSSIHFCLKTESSSVCPTNNQGMIFSSKRRDTSTQLSYWELENTQFGPALPVFSKKFSVVVELGTFLGVLSSFNMAHRSLRIATLEELLRLLSFAMERMVEFDNRRGNG